MSMSSYVEAIRPPDAKWSAMKAVWDACKAAGTTVPAEVDGFFNGEPPDATGVVVKHVSGCSSKLPEWVTAVRRDMEDGFEVDITKLPKDVTVLRFTNSY